jgi:hypothetical protein
MTLIRNSESWQVARALIDRFGFVDAHRYAFARGHELASFAPVGTPEARLEWRRIATRIRWLYADAHPPAPAPTAPREPMKPLNVRSTW